MSSAHLGLGIEALGQGRFLLHGRSKALGIALFLVLLLIALQSARMGVSGLIVELAQTEVDRWTFAPVRRGLRDINRVAGYFADSLSWEFGNPRALEGEGALDLARVRLARTPRDAVAFTKDARLRFRSALLQRPTSPFLWANLARSKLLLDEIDDEFFRAVRHANELGPWEPVTQRSILFTALAAWEKLDSSLQQMVVGVLARGASRDARKLFEIVKSYQRFGLVCGNQEYNLVAGADCKRSEVGVKSGRRMIKDSR